MMPVELLRRVPGAFEHWLFVAGAGAGSSGGDWDRFQSGARHAGQLTRPGVGVGAVGLEEWLRIHRSSV